VCFNEASQGLLLFLLYGSSYRFFKTWYLLFKNPKALLSSKYTSTDGETSKKAFTVEGRKVEPSTTNATHSTGSKQMVDEISEDSEEGDEEEEEGEDGTVYGKANNKGHSDDEDDSTTSSSSDANEEGEGEAMELEIVK